MDITEIDELAEKFSNGVESTAVRTGKKKVAPKVPNGDADKSSKTTEKKRKAPKITATTDVHEYEHIDEQNGDKTLEKENDTQVPSTLDQEVPIKPKKKKAPKAEAAIDNNESTVTDQVVKKKKSKVPKVAVVDDDFQISENALMDTLETVPGVKSKSRSKKSKLPAQPVLEPFDDVQITNLDETNLVPSELTINNVENGAAINGDVSQYDTNASEYERALLDCYSQLAAQVNFIQYVGEDQWGIVHLPKSARSEPKSRIRKMLQGNNNKDDRSTSKKPTGPKPSLFRRLRVGVNTLVRDENNLIFGERSPYDMVDIDDDDDDDDVDTDNLHRYAQKLRELEDKDREVNPEYLVLRDGKTVFAVHESDADGKMKLATRKPIYDRFADQGSEEQSEKKKLLSRLKLPFTRNRDNGKDTKSPKSANATPNSRMTRKANEKSFGEDVTVPTSVQ